MHEYLYGGFLLIWSTCNYILVCKIVITKYGGLGSYYQGLNMFLVLISMSTFRFSPSKVFLQLLVPIKFSFTTFGPSFKVKSYVEFLFLNKILNKNS